MRSGSMALPRQRVEAVSPVRELKILHVISAPAAGGAEVYVKQLATQLRRMGHRPAIAFLARAADEGNDAAFEQRFLAELDDAGIAHFFIGRGARANPLLGALRVARYCREQGVDVYHAHLKYGIAFGLLLRVPRVTTHHNIVAEAPPWVYRLLGRIVDQYVAVSTACGRALERFSGRCVVVIRNAIDTAPFTPSVRQPSGERKFECICVGRIAEQKNYSLLIRALALLPPGTLNRLHVSIVGEGPPHRVAQLEREISAAGLNNVVTLLGVRLDIPRLLGAAQLLVMSSGWEGLPIALLEATASGLPFIATDVGGCREIAEAFGNGVIVTPDDEQALAGAIAALVSDPGAIARLSRSAIAARPSISIEAAARAHLDLYDRLIAR